MAKRRIRAGEARKLQGQLVYAVLRDGSYYVGSLAGVRNGELLLSGVIGGKTLPKSAFDKRGQVKVSGLLGSLLGGLGGGAGQPGGANPLGFGGAGAGGGGGPFGPGAGGSAGGGLFGGGGGWFGRIMPGIRVGMQMLQFLGPLLGFKI